MSDRSKRAVLRVSSRDGSAHVTFAGTAVVGRIGRGLDVRNFRESEVPFELELPDEDVCIVVRREAGAGKVQVEYWVEHEGERAPYCRGESSEVLILRKDGGVFCSGIGPAAAPPG